MSEDVEELVAHGIPPFIIDAWKQSAPRLNELQRRAVNEHGVLAGRSVVVSAPTSSGKTMVGELAALRAFAERRRAIFLLPMRALVNDKYDDFGRKYGTLGVRVIRATGEMQDEVPDLLKGRYDLCLMTYEKASALLLAYPHVLRGVGSVIIDEVQMLADKSRGANLEFLLTLLKYRRREGVRPQLILLSAVIGDTNGLERWLTASLLKSDKRPVPLREGVIRSNGAFRFVDDAGVEAEEPCIRPEPRKGSAQDYVVPLVRKLVGDGESVIVFRETKGETRGVAKYLSEEVALPPAAEAIAALPAGDPSASSSALRECLQHGVAFHNADLDRAERRVIETAFRENRGIKVLVATTTIAMGVNTPANSVIIVGLDHPGGEPYSVAEYKNMVGRAGRYGFTAAGKSLTICTSPADEWKIWRNYVKGSPEALTSRFLEEDPLLVILRVLATADQTRAPKMTAEQILGFIESSFAAQQAGRAVWQRARLLADFGRLLHHGLIAQDSGGFSLTELGRVVGELGIKIESVLRIVDAVRGVQSGDVTERALLALAQTTVELDDVLMPTHRKSHKEQQRWRSALMLAGVSGHITSAVLRTQDATARAKRFAAVALWTSGMEIREIESNLGTHMRDNDFAGPIRGAAERTRDMLSAITRITGLTLHDPEPAFARTADRLAVQLEFGIPGRCVALARILGNRLGRGDYMALVRSHLVDGKSLAECRDEQLEAVLGSRQKMKQVREAQARLVLEFEDASEEAPLVLPPVD